jgi:hypothetical protein
MTNKLLKVILAFNFCPVGIDKLAFIRKLPNGKYKVISEKGKNLGVYDSRSGAEKRLRQIEYFKHKDNNSADDFIDLTNIDDFSLSSIMRELNKQDRELALEFLSLYKHNFDKNKDDNQVLRMALNQFGEEYNIKLNEEMIKNAASEVGDPALVGKYLSDIIRFTTSRISPENRAKAIARVKEKISNLNIMEIANKNLPPSASMGQSITFVKHVLFNHDPKYIKEVINHVIKNL